jgi:hypothetical protein
MQTQTQIASKIDQIYFIKNFFSHIPLGIYLIGILISVLTLAPYWRAQTQVQPGWTFTGNVLNSPDLMQYRVWERQTQESGIIVNDKFTSESNRPHLLVVLYFTIGQISKLINIPPEFIYAYLGSIFAFLFTIFLYTIIRFFIKSPFHIWSVFLVTLFGGGLGVHLKLISNSPLLQNIFVIRETLIEGLWSWPAVFENYRGNYIINSLFDTHFLVIWFFATAAVISLYLTIRKFATGYLILTSCLYIFVTLLHLYEGITLIAITIAIVILLWCKKLATRPTFLTLFVCILAVIACLTWQVMLFRTSGIPLPTWHGVNILFSILVISYPLAWIFIVIGIIDYWQKATFNETFLLGWALGCTVITLSGPFYPYPDRGTLTLQIPLYIIAGMIYFSRYKRVTVPAALFAIFLVGLSPVWFLHNRWEWTSFRTDTPYIFINNDQQELINFLRNSAAENDILITDMTKGPAQNDLLWLAPEYPGKFYCAHFFLTVDYDRKCAELVNFYQNTPEEQVTFLQTQNIRFIYVDPEKDINRFKQIPNLALMKSNRAGTIFEYTKNIASTSR